MQLLFLDRTQVMFNFRIGWLDSTGQPSRVHCTNDNGSTTICGKQLFGQVFAKVTTRRKGQSRYCRTCFADQKKKSLDWINMSIKSWKTENIHTAYSQGWGLFTLDDSTLAIQKLDEPEEVSLDVLNEEFKGTVFESDDEAIEYVRNNTGCPTCVLAIGICFP